LQEKFRRLEGQEAQKTREEYEKKKADREAYLRKKVPFFISATENCSVVANVVQFIGERR